MNPSIEATVDQFIKDFNTMCKTTRKDLLVRERVVQYETGSGIRKYNITYKAKKGKNKIDIVGETAGFWIFKSKFPLFSIQQVQGKLKFSGLYTSKFTVMEESELKQNLQKFLEICEKLPKDAFTKS